MRSARCAGGTHASSDTHRTPAIATAYVPGSIPNGNQILVVVPGRLKPSGMTETARFVRSDGKTLLEDYSRPVMSSWPFM
jgi:hypothetical protein